MSNINDDSDTEDGKVPAHWIQGEEERRALRAAFRKAYKNLLATQDLLEDVSNAEAFDEAREANNALFPRVTNPREAILDGINLDLLASKARVQADRLMKVPRYNPIKLQQELKTRFSNRDGRFDWKELGRKASVCFKIPPVQSFLSGPLNRHYVPTTRKKPRPRGKSSSEAANESDVEDEEPETVVVRKQNHVLGEITSTETNTDAMATVLIEKCAEQRKRWLEEINDLPTLEKQEGSRKKKLKMTEEIDGLQFLFNPNSFTQTVENLFYFSFLVKECQASIRLSDDEGIRVRHVRDDEKRSVVGRSKQTITSLSMRGWRQLCQAHGLERGYLPHREELNGASSTSKEKTYQSDSEKGGASVSSTKMAYQPDMHRQPSIARSRSSNDVLVGSELIPQRLCY